MKENGNIELCGMHKGTWIRVEGNVVEDTRREARVAMTAFTPDADFSIMSHEMSLMITDIIQKTKIKVDEKGIEAAAATAILMLEGCAPDEEHEIKEFIADRPFKYMLLTDTAEPELLFYGQIIE